MNDPMRRALQRLQGPVGPEREFADALFTRLLEEAGTRRGPVLRVPGGARRALVAVAALGLALAVFFITLPILRPADRGGIAQYGEVPSFRGVVEFTVSPDLLAGIDEGGSDALTSGTHRIEVVYAGPDAWRFELLDDGFTSMLPPVAGSFGAWDGERFRVFHAGENAYGPQGIGPSGFTILNPLAWTASGQGWEEVCRDPEFVGSDTLLGRDATTVGCGGQPPGIRLWLDDETGLVLRAEVASDVGSPSFEGPFGPGSGGGFRFVELEVGLDLSEAAAFEPPAGAVPFAEVVTPPTTLSIGELVPALPALEAAGLDVTPSNGRPTAIYAWASWCPPCTGAPFDAFDEEAARFAGELNAFTVALRDDSQAAAEVVAAEGYTVALVHDPEGELEAWGLSGLPALVLLDGDGRLLGAYAGDLDRDDVRAILRAVVAGESLPDVGGNTAQQIA